MGLVFGGPDYGCRGRCVNLTCQLCEVDQWNLLLYNHLFLDFIHLKKNLI